MTTACQRCWFQGCTLTRADSSDIESRGTIAPHAQRHDKISNAIFSISAAQPSGPFSRAPAHIYIYILKKKIPEGQEHVPRLEPTAPIRLADRNHAHYPSKIDGSGKGKTGMRHSVLTRAGSSNFYSRSMPASSCLVDTKATDAVMHFFHRKHPANFCFPYDLRSSSCFLLVQQQV